jgi:type IV secretion system protein VirB6
MIACAPPDSTRFVAERVADYVDCHAQSLAQDGFATLAGGWIGPALLGGCLTIYVALIGYRLILGAPLGTRDLVLAAARAGVVVALAASWSAFGATAYRLVMDGPAELAAQLLPDGVTLGSLPQAAQRLDQDYNSLHMVVAGGLAAGGNPATAAAAPDRAQTPPSLPPSLTVPADPILDRAGLWLVVTVVGSLAALRLAAGLLLGCGPLFITLGLFNTTLGLLEGWVRGLAGVFVGAAGSLVVTSLEFGFLESQVLAGGPTLGAPSELGEPALAATTWLFALAMGAVLILAAMIGRAFRFAGPLRDLFHEPRGAFDPRFGSRPGAEPLAAPLPRAQTVADAVRRISLRETRVLARTSAEAASVSRSLRRGASSSPLRQFADLHTPGGAPRRRVSPRTAIAEDRDRAG